MIASALLHFLSLSYLPVGTGKTLGERHLHGARGCEMCANWVEKEI
jgi:hypothetical protein